MRSTWSTTTYLAGLWEGATPTCHLLQVSLSTLEKMLCTAHTWKLDEELCCVFASAVTCVALRCLALSPLQGPKLVAVRDLVRQMGQMA